MRSSREYPSLNWAELQPLEYLQAPLPLQVHRSDAVGDRIMMDNSVTPRVLAVSMAALQSALGTRLPRHLCGREFRESLQKVAH